MSREEQKLAIKEALKEWLDSKFQDFGRWAFLSICAAALVAILTLILKANGWSLTKDAALLLGH